MQLEGVDAAAVNTVKRADGKLQLTIAGWPVYRYSGDKAAGDTTGQGVGKVWFAVTPRARRPSRPADPAWPRAPPGPAPAGQAARGHPGTSHRAERCEVPPGCEGPG